MARDVDQLLRQVKSEYEKLAGKPLEKTLWFGAHLPEYGDAPTAKEIGLEIAAIDDAQFRKLAIESDISFIQPMLKRGPQVIVLNELLEACANPGDVIASLVAALPPSTVFVV